eukprot:CAMPEP_0197177816 /NCGR_PEP_ID=MMETSP1423-20130617/3284_1 /TAXON_ID=476441 /ORGANISM="Pseudo-nitzschia heimii, Strain UNC1101" /LENGTH=423 /DNA_ID=CAMNT_0042627423 /DNA_START=310 /DNA_END=1581 /DNA_ORIENTATION=-
MPSSYRGIDDECHIWRIDVENDYRQSKRQRRDATGCFEKQGIDISSLSSASNTETTSFSCSSMEELVDTSSSLETSSEMMTDDSKDSESVESILTNYIRVGNEISIVEEGLDKLLERLSVKKNSMVLRQQHREAVLNLGGHWMITGLLANLMQVHDRDDITRMDIMNDEDSNDFHNSIKDDDDSLVTVVARSCQILRELLTTNRSNTHLAFDTNENLIRYQIYYAGGLDVVVSALKRYPTSFDIQLAGCQVLSCLMSSDWSNANHGENKDCDGNNRRQNTSTATTPLISKLYQSTERLNIIVRLVGNGMRNSLQDRSDTQMWQLYYVVSDIVRSIVWQLPVRSSCRSEIIRTIRKHFIINDFTVAMDECNEDHCNGDNYRSRRESGYHNFNTNRSGNMTQYGDGIGRHMYEHLMLIFNDKEDH